MDIAGQVAIKLCTVRGFTLIIDLAVVTALALAAVLGAMSLANPAQAAFEAPLSSHLTERVDSPLMMMDAGTFFVVVGKDDDTTTDGVQVLVDLNDYFKVAGYTGTDADNFEIPVWDEVTVAPASSGISAVAATDSTSDEDTLTLTVTENDLPEDLPAEFTFTVKGYQEQERVLPVADPAVDTDATNCAGEGGMWLAGDALTDIAPTTDGCYHVVEQMITGIVTDVSLTSSTDTPGKAGRYTLEYVADNNVAGLDGLITLKMKDFGVPGSIDTEKVIIRVAHDVAENAEDFNEPSNPQDIETDDEEIVLHLGDVNPNGDDVQNISEDDVVRITIQASAGVTMPTEGSDKSWTVVDEGTSNTVHTARKVSLDEDEGGRGDMLTATGKGFKNDLTIHFWLDADQDGILDSAEHTLCSATVGSNDVGSCEFEVNAPPFMGGPNFVNAVDGLTHFADPGEAHEFTLESSMKVTPGGGTPGESLLVELFDIPDTAGTQITKVELARRSVCGGTAGDPRNYANGEMNCNYAAIGSTGNGNFRLRIPDGAPAGRQDLRVTVGTGEGADTPAKTIIISPSALRSTPTEVVPNQRISLVGAGFNSRAKIGDCDDCDESSVTIGGDDIVWDRINGGDDIDVDSGGNWSAAIDLPLDANTVEPGMRVIRVRDSMGRTGAVEVTFPARKLTITPSEGRVGTLALVEGEGFPGKNDEGDSFSVEIIYESANGRTTVSAQPNASGRFETEIRIPTTAGIPSTNTVKAQFEYGPNNTEVVTATTHQVPEGTIALSTTSGGPGSQVTITGGGFKNYVPVSSVKVGPIDVTPAPKPSTDAQGRLEFTIQIPGLDNGIQTIEVQVGQTTASKGFTVRPSGINPGDVVEVAKGLENLGENLDSIWHFNNDSKMWSFYDGLEGSDLTELITGETYLLQVKSTAEVILNNKTRNLTCNDAGNCWNQIVW